MQQNTNDISTSWPIVFQEDFNVLQGALPANWTVERNSNLPTTAWEGHVGSFELKSAGNKYIPVTPDLTDFRIDIGFSVNYSVANAFAFMLIFSYDLSRREGNAVKISSSGSPAVCSLQFGTVADNIFTAVSPAVSGEPQPDYLLGKMTATLECQNGVAKASFAGITAEFKTFSCKAGKIALSREHFLDLFTVSAFTIRTPKTPVPDRSRTIHATLPTDAMPYPINCELKLDDYGDCTIATATLSGGVRSTPPGEGDYHCMRADMLTDTYLKIFSDGNYSKNTLYPGLLLLVHEELAPGYFYSILYKKPQWPLVRKVSFVRPSGKMYFAIGADRCLHTTYKTQAMTPGETIFDDDGNTVYSGKALSEGPGKIVFKSQPDKEIIARLPKDDPRYDRAVEFAKKNHYFLKDEPISFSILASSHQALPFSYIVTLEDAFLNKIRDLKSEITFSTEIIADFKVETAHITCEQLNDLPEGVYHLRVKSNDETGVALEDYCAFEVMGREDDALPPPLVSGLPYLYDSRTETRGLETDSIDPWHPAASVDEGHYMACANFLPKAARDFKIAPTIHAYHREWFLWLASRCSNAPMAKDNMDLIAQADFVSNKEELASAPLFLKLNYLGERVNELLQFIHAHPDDRYDQENIRELEKALAEGRAVDSVSTSTIINGGYGPEDPALSPYNFGILAQYHWNEWLEYRSQVMYKKTRASIMEMRKVQPRIKYSAYGPENIYCARYKGQEFVSVHQAKYFDDDMMGFLQYEDYPFSCSYPIVRGTYALAASLMVLPFARIYPEYYTRGFQGCPDGAVYYAHPPFGFAKDNNPRRFRLCAFDYAFASAHFLGGEFRYWSKCGFQACGFSRDYYEELLHSWYKVYKHKPQRPFKSAAYVYNPNARGVVKIHLKDYMSDVRETAFEDVPYAYEMSRTAGQVAGFQINLNEIEKLSAEDTDLLVLPPLTGASAQELQAIRELHAQGVNLLLFEDATGLEDIFGVKPLPKPQAVTNLHSTALLPFSLTEYCEEELCTGKYTADGADILIDAEIPVLLSTKNGNARAVFCNVPPTLVRDCQLHQRESSGRDSISELVNKSIAYVIGEMTGSIAQTTQGMLIGFMDEHGNSILAIQNTDEDNAINPEVRYRKHSPAETLIECDRPCRVIDDDGMHIILRLAVPPETAALVVIG